MDRLACVDVPAFPLQLLLRRNPEDRAHPAAVVAEDRPNAKVLWVNEAAFSAGVRSGMRYAAALSLAAELRAGVVPDAEIAEQIELVAQTLRGFSPHVEPCREEPGIFWLDAAGLGGLFRSASKWAAATRAKLEETGFVSALVVGWTRFGTWAVARARSGGAPGSLVTVFRSREEEARASRAVALARIVRDGDARAALEKLGVRTIEDFLALPAAGVGLRLGAEVEHLHRLAAGLVWAPLAPEPARIAPSRHVDLEQPLAEQIALGALVEELLPALLAELAARGEALRELVLVLHIEKRRGAEERAREERVRPAEPTSHAAEILDLVRRRLASFALEAPVEAITLTALGVRTRREQGSLCTSRPRRDLVAAGRALARLRAELGEKAVVRARLREGHLPSARYAWEPIAALAVPKPREVGTRTLVRRILGRPIPLPPRSSREPDGWLLRGLEHGPVQSFVGPYVLSGGWWGSCLADWGTRRDYYFAKMRSGEVLWVFHDRARRRWFLHGAVE